MDGDSEEQEQEQDDLLNELKAEVEALREEVSEINEPTRLVYSEAERKTTTHFMDDLTGDEDDAGVQSKFIEFVRERYAGTTATMTLPDNTDLIIAKYGTCLKMCYLTRIDEFAQPKVPSGLATLVREELVGGGGTSAPKMAFVFWDTCGGVAESCACGETDSEIGAGEWEVASEGECGYFPVITSVQKGTFDSEGTILDITKRNVHVDKCGKILKLGSATSYDLLIPCECEEEPPPCPEGNSTYTVEWKTWKSPSFGTWNSCSTQFPGMGNTYYPYRIGRTVFTRGAGGGYSVVNAVDHQTGLYTITNCTGGTDPTLVNSTVYANVHLTYDTGAARWQFTVDDGYFYQPDCSPIGSFTNSDGIWYYEATLT